MLFYAALTIAGIIAAAVVVWVGKALLDAGSSLYYSFFSSASKAKLAHLNGNIETAPAPWGWAPNQQVADTGRFATKFERASSSGSEDWKVRNSLEGRNRDLAWERFERSSDVASGQNVLKGYDMKKRTNPDTSCWPYQDSVVKSSVVDTPKTLVEDGGDADRPTKPWGW